MNIHIQEWIAWILNLYSWLDTLLSSNWPSQLLGILASWSAPLCTPRKELIINQAVFSFALLDSDPFSLQAYQYASNLCSPRDQYWWQYCWCCVSKEPCSPEVCVWGAVGNLLYRPCTYPTIYKACLLACTRNIVIVPHHMSYGIIVKSENALTMIEDLQFCSVAWEAAAVGVWHMIWGSALWHCPTWQGIT